MSKFDNQILNRAVSIQNLSRTNMNQFEHVHLNMKQLKSLYINSKKINEISSDLIALEKYLVHYQHDVSRAQGSEATTEEINKASHAAARPGHADNYSYEHPAKHHPQHQSGDSRITKYHSTPRHVRHSAHEHSKHIILRPKLWYEKLLKGLKKLMLAFFDDNTKE